MMNDMQKKLKISIRGRSYAIVTDESEDDVFEASQRVIALLADRFHDFSSLKEQEVIALVLEMATQLVKKEKVIKCYESKAHELSKIMNNEILSL